ncbi:heptaprenyl diphosphate synthase [Gracilibacillus halotolerans]|uniref:Heptaprenyl diphosphate synthase n=1 Tax=Gracilibacillus halotolerans TaxID=74386 RepID=A0A841RKD4_9BACI|nr:heptaprenyl diphosphate synthase [Gracilibacillus halotolerans]
MNEVETLTQSIPSYRKLIENEIEHTYLTLHIEQPIIEEDKLKLLHILLMNYEDIEDSIVSVMLVQIALNTHDLIAQKTTVDSSDRKSQQLTVLAGDFYSGLYYKRLSEADNILLTGVLANGISDITEQKMDFFYTSPQEATQFAEGFCELDFVLIKHVAFYSNWHSEEDHRYMKNWLFYRRLLQEADFMEEEKETLFSQLFHKNVQKTDYKTFLKDEIQKREKYLGESNSILKQYLS